MFKKTGENSESSSSLLPVSSSKLFIDVLKESGVLPGFKVDTGTVELNGTNGEIFTQGLDGLAQRCQKYYEAGAPYIVETQHGDPWFGFPKGRTRGIAQHTVRALQRTVPPAIPAIVFLSGGESEEEATINLNVMNKLQTKKPWSLSFSFGRALQQSTLKAWGGKKENVAKAQEAFLVMWKA
ncbi:Fructose-bisphosphate aldolase [Hibiscus syriacus]|uniref:fructose-bisphosphate aldolase n=1 Tax=Hibiscus syriacus TaxID=106335 RepID=A0A6A2ZFY0_HIBSY|nr:Fructose-bisphosphate aldolase [Hibiscus syriacus]